MRKNGVLLTILFFTSVIILSSGASAATYTVTNCADSLSSYIPGSLRAAIGAANAAGGLDYVVFNIPTSEATWETGSPSVKWFKIKLAGALTIEEVVTSAGPTVVDGTTQTSWGGDLNPYGPEIELDGSSAGNVNGIEIRKNMNNTVIKGLVINRFSSSGKAGMFINTNNNRISGCYIGTNVTGEVAALNDRGIIINSASGNIIGSTEVSGRNVISGNGSVGLIINGTGANTNEVLGNYIGISANNIQLSNTTGGVLIDAGNHYNKIGNGISGGGNVISCSVTDPGLIINGSNSNEVLGNFIGTDATGTQIGYGNSKGIYIQGGSQFNNIGNGISAGRNIIGSNTNGIEIDGSSNTKIVGNYIGAQANGTSSLSNWVGIYLWNGSKYNQIGGSTAGERNVISGNSTIGINMSQTGTDSNEVLGNFIGIAANGTTDLGNGGNGVSVNNGAQYNKIGGNVISWNHSTGASITAANYNEIYGNVIGTDSTGSSVCQNGGNGVEVVGASQYNLVGGKTTDKRNIISGNTFNGVFVGSNSNEVAGNYIGTNASGTSPLTNESYGLVISNGAQFNIIGGLNVISGNRSGGIYIYNSGIDITSYNRILGNYIGTKANSTEALPNTDRGVAISGGAQHNQIGGTGPGEGNIISGNTSHGISIAGTGTDSNEVYNNYIGIDGTGTASLANGENGILINNGSRYNKMGDGTANGRNVIAYNGSSGVFIDGSGGTSASYNKITRNSIFENTGLGILLVNGGNNGFAAPAIASAYYNPSTTFTTVSGTSGSNTTIEVFTTGAPDPTGSGEGRTYLASTAEASGSWEVTLSGLTAGTTLTATATDINNNTSMFSLNKIITLLATSEVITTADSGYGSLRDAINYSNSNPGSTIFFNIPTAEATWEAGSPDVKWYRINLSTKLPTITAEVTIDGPTQPTSESYHNPYGPEIEITMLSPAAMDDGMYVDASDCVVKGLVINRFSNAGNGIVIRGHRNRIYGCYIGTTISGEAAAGNSRGIQIWGGSTRNIIGSTESSNRNLISGNTGYGISISSANTSSNEVLGNFIGTNRSGTAAVGNGNYGILISEGVKRPFMNFYDGFNWIGNGTADGRNIISGNGGGIYLSGTCRNNILGNYIGVDVNGTSALGNTADGVYIEQKIGEPPYYYSIQNYIGDGTEGGRNVISGNGTGVRINGYGTVSLQSYVYGNYIGLDKNGDAALGNTGNGVHIAGSARYNYVGDGTAAKRNIISGNGGHGIYVSGEANDNSIHQNYIGTDAGGTLDRGNASSGVLIKDSSYIQVGFGNIISGNGLHGLQISGEAVTCYSSRIYQNYIGTDAGGTAEVGNGGYGVYISGAVQNSRIGNDGMNVISGNDGGGVWIDGASAQTNNVYKNYIGVDSTGAALLGNTGPGVKISGGARSNIVGLAGGNGNIISGNGSHGILISGTGTNSNEVMSNYIGTNALGADLGNVGSGVEISGEAKFNKIGYAYAGYGNTISRNAVGVAVRGISTLFNKISWNSIYENDGLGIVLADSGNNNQPAPAIVTALYYGGLTTVTGESTAGATVEIFSTNGPDPTGSGEGKTYLGSTLEASGHWSTVLAGVTAGTTLSATATDTNSNTSMFSVNMVTAASTPSVMSILLKDRTSGSTVYTNEQPTSVEAAGVADASEMRMAEDSGFTVNDTGWIAYSALYEYTLTSVDGTKTIYYKVRDAILTESGTVSATIVLDTTPPSSPVLVTPPDGSLTNDATPDFTWEASTDNLSGIASYEIKIDTDLATQDATTSYTPLSDLTDGAHTWEVKARDGAGNWGSYSGTSSFEVGANIPVVGSLSLKDRTTGSTVYTRVNIISVEALGVSGSPAEMRMAQDSSFTQNSTAWKSYANPTEYTLIGSDGTKEVYYKLRSAALNESAVVNDSIILDTISPEVAVTEPAAGNVLLGGATFEVRWTAADEGPTLKPDPITIRFSSNEGTTWSELATGLPNNGSYIWDVPNDATNRGLIKVLAEDKAGWIGEGVSGRFVILLKGTREFATVRLEGSRLQIVLLRVDETELKGLTVLLMSPTGVIRSFSFTESTVRGQQEAGPGYTILSWDAGERVLNLPKGIYPVVIRYGNKTTKTYLIKP